MSAHFTIGALARAAKVPVTTLRYYERAGLLPAEGRSAGNYRSYTERSLERVRFIRAAQANGFTLDDVKRLHGFQDGALAPCNEVQTLIESRLRDLEERLRELRGVQSVLQRSLAACQRSRSGRCEVLEGLAEGRPLARRRARGPLSRPSSPRGSIRSRGRAAFAPRSP